MSDTVIKVEGLGKKYVINHAIGSHGRQSYKRFSDVLLNAAKAPLGWLKAKKQEQRTQNTKEDFWALQNISFEIKRGDVVGIVGRNGAGKSTLLKILSRITEPTVGRIEITGRVASLLEVGTGFHPELTGRENIFLNGAILGMTRAEIRKKFDEIVAFAEVERFLDTPVKRYSSGMYVRLAFAVAAHLEPEILVVDEVLAVGDAQFQRKCLGKMSEVSSKEGRTVLFVSHNMAAVTALCRRGILLGAGRLKIDASAKEAVDFYVNDYRPEQVTSPLRHRRDREGDGSMRFVDLTLGTDVNPRSGFWVVGEPAFLHLQIECVDNTRYKNIEIALGIKKMDGTPLLYLGTKVTKQDLPEVNGTASSTCRIERNPLEPGSYMLTVELKQNGIIVDLVQSATVIDVAAGDYYHTGVLWPYGGFLCDYSWSHSAK